MTVRATYRFARIPEWVLTHPQLNGTAVQVFGVLDRFDGRECIPGIDAIAERIGCSRGTVKNALASLEAVGALVRQARHVDGRQTSNRYVLAGDSPLLPGGQDSAPSGGQDSAPSGGQDSAPDLEQEDLEQEDLELLRADALVAAGFAVFWDLYPRKVGKPAARTRWRAALKKASAEEIMDGLSRWLDYWLWRNEPEFVPHPSTWLNQERWNDLPPPILIKAKPSDADAYAREASQRIMERRQREGRR